MTPMSKERLIRQVLKADDPMVRVLIMKYSATNQIKGVRTQYREHEGKREIDTARPLRTGILNDSRVPTVRFSKGHIERSVFVCGWSVYPHRLTRVRESS